MLYLWGKRYSTGSNYNRFKGGTRYFLVFYIPSENVGLEGLERTIDQ